MGLAILAWDGGNRFRFELGRRNRFYAWAVGPPRARSEGGIELLADPVQVSEILGPVRESSLGRGYLDLPPDALDRENRSVQLISYRSASGDGPAVSRIVTVPRYAVPGLPNPEHAEVVSSMHPTTEPLAVPFRYRPEQRSEAFFIESIVAALPSLIPAVAPVIGSLVGSIAPQAIGAIGGLLGGGAPAGGPAKVDPNLGTNVASAVSDPATVALISDQKPFPGTGWTPPMFLREIVMMGFVILAWLTTKSEIREGNKFNFHAILEVAALFIGIFIAMQIPVQVLRYYGGDFGLTEPWHYFWLTGTLSSFLDNAPTYVVFFETAGAGTEPLPTTVISEPLLIGISLGAVFMGAMTYIGNGPNFMVKSIAEQGGIRMPSFFGYMLYSGIVLIPLFLATTLLFR